MAASVIRDVNTARFAILAGVIVALISQIILTLLFTGLAGLALPPTTAAPNTFNWSVFMLWTLAGIIAAGFGGYATGWVLGRASDWDAGILAFIGWAVAILIVTFFGAIAANSGSNLLRAFVSPAYGYWSADAATAAARRAASVASLASVIALLLGAAASIAGSIVATEEPNGGKRRRR
jgi:hypothetical protein